MKVWPFKHGAFKEFIREQMLLGTEDRDLRVRTLPQ